MTTHEEEALYTGVILPLNGSAPKPEKPKRYGTELFFDNVAKKPKKPRSRRQGYIYATAEEEERAKRHRDYQRQRTIEARAHYNGNHSDMKQRRTERCPKCGTMHTDEEQCLPTISEIVKQQRNLEEFLQSLID